MVKMLRSTIFSAKTTFFVFLVSLLVGCGGSGSDSSSTSDPPHQNINDNPGDEVIWNIDIDWHVANDEGIEGAPEYGTSNPPYTLILHHPESTVFCFYADTDNGRVHGTLHLPYQWTQVTFVRQLYLVLTITEESEATGKTALYTHGEVELYHKTVTLELREAATMTLVASEIFEGNNTFPDTVVWGATMTSDEINSKTVEDWLKTYVDPSE